MARTVATLAIALASATARAQGPIPLSPIEPRTGDSLRAAAADDLAARVRTADSTLVAVEAQGRLLEAQGRQLTGIIEAIAQNKQANAEQLEQIRQLRAQRDSLLNIAAIEQQRTRSQRDSLLRVTDSLASVLRTSYVKRDTTCDSYRIRAILPVRSTFDSHCYFRQPDVTALNSAVVSGASDQASAYVEVLSYSIAHLRGTVAAVVATSDDTLAQKADLQRLVAGGGSTVFGFAWPVATFVGGQGNYYSSLSISPRVGIDLPALGSSGRAKNTNYDAAGDFVFRARSYERNVSFVLHVRGGYLVGNREYFEQLGLSSHRTARYATYAFGIQLQDAYVITITRPFHGPAPLRALGTQVTLSAYRQRSQ